MSLPDRVFLIVLLPDSGRDPDRMTLLSRTRAGGERVTPVFSTMLLATTFLDRAQALGASVPLDYIFPAAASRLADDLPEYVPILDIGPEAFFEGVGTT
ncbi:MAG TPA: hypothetical protein VIO62_05570 [Candidatus Dormibacteraeota bacterium]